MTKKNNFSKKLLFFIGYENKKKIFVLLEFFSLAMQCSDFPHNLQKQ